MLEYSNSFRVLLLLLLLLLLLSISSFKSNLNIPLYIVICNIVILKGNIIKKDFSPFLIPLSDIRKPKMKFARQNVNSSKNCGNCSCYRYFKTFFFFSVCVCQDNILP